MLIALSSCRGAPGVSSLALTLATAWPDRRDRVLVEADGSGGVAAARYDLPLEPGTATLLSAARSGRLPSDDDLSSIARSLQVSGLDIGTLWAVPSPLAAHEAAELWRPMVVPAAEAMQLDHRFWFADCGRVWPGAPAEAIMATASVNILVADTSLASLLVLPSRVEAIPTPVAIILVGSTPHTLDEVKDFTGAYRVWSVSHIAGFDSLAARFSTSTRARRNPLWRAAINITQTLSRDLAADPLEAIGNRASPSLPPPPESAKPAPLPPPIPDRGDRELPPFPPPSSSSRPPAPQPPESPSQPTEMSVAGGDQR